MARYRGPASGRPRPASGLAGMHPPAPGPAPPAPPAAPHASGSLHPQTQSRLLASAGDVSVLKATTFSFDAAHPALADKVGTDLPRIAPVLRQFCGHGRHLNPSPHRSQLTRVLGPFYASL